ncbi:MAG TPA: deoxyribonuclease IV [Candidatus Babeliales bacterium]|nr:deoxyribonuclease IV [Candidatus Babeliales bacterium]
MKKKHSLLFGAHMSISGGLDLAIQRGESIGCTAIQIFTKSNRQWYAKPLTDQTIITFKKAWEESSIKSIIAHASYLINIGSPNEATEKKSLEALILEFKRCADLTIPYLVIHPGSHTNTDEESCITRINNNLNTLFATVPDGTILLETMAGQGSNVGYTFEQLAQIIAYSPYKHRLGICFDTCHAFTAGYNFTTEKMYHDMWEKFDNIIGIKKLKAIHVNDSQQGIGSRVDRHTDIGKGKIGLKSFELLFNDPLFFDIPKILETPKNDLTDDKNNMNVLIGLLNTTTKKLLNYDK